MAVYAVGDVQGCYEALSRLLDKIRFDQANDQLWFCGDLVNRGGQSLETMRLIYSIRQRVIVTLGNHDLSLLAIAQRSEQDQRKVNAELQSILFAEDREPLLDWLRHQKLIHVDRELGFAMVHAGLAPKWRLKIAQSRAKEVEDKLQSNGYKKLLKHMYGDRPTWSPKLQGIERLRSIINVFTRIRFCTPSGRIGFEEKGRPGSQKPGLYPWFEVPGHSPRSLPIIFGHWSTLNLFMGLGVYAIDTGCVWGGKLTALELGPELRLHQVPGRDVPADGPRGDD